MSLRPPYFLRQHSPDSDTTQTQVRRRSQTNPYHEEDLNGRVSEYQQQHHAAPFNTRDQRGNSIFQQGRPPLRQTQQHQQPAYVAVTRSGIATPSVGDAQWSHDEVGGGAPRSLMAYYIAKAEHEHSSRAPLDYSPPGRGQPSPVRNEGGALQFSPLPKTPIGRLDHHQYRGRDTSPVVEHASRPAQLHTSSGRPQQDVSPAGRIQQQVQQRPGDDAREREHYTRDVMKAVDNLIETHNNNSLAEVEKYRTIAEETQRSLHYIQEALAMEGVDVSFVPSAVSTAASMEPAWSAVRFILSQAPHEECAAAADRILTSLLSIDDNTTDIPKTVEGAVMEAMAVYTNSLLCRARDASGTTFLTPSSLSVASADILSMRGRRELETEIQCLRDELAALREASIMTSTDPLVHTLHELSYDKLHTMLAASRLESARLREALLDAKRTHQLYLLKEKVSPNSNESITRYALGPTFESTAATAAEVLRDTRSTSRSLNQTRDIFDKSRSMHRDNLSIVFNKTLNTTNDSPVRASEMDVWNTTLELLAKYGGHNDK